MRNVEDLILKTLREVLFEATGVPSGNIWLKKPEAEFVNKKDGPNAGDGVAYLPSIGISYYKDAKILPNNYGNIRRIRTSVEISNELTPIGEIELSLGIHLFAKTHAEINNYGNLLYMYFLENRLIELRDDSLPGEYFSIQFLTMRYSDYEKPLHKIFYVKCGSRILKESTGYVIGEVLTTIYTHYGNEEDMIEEPAISVTRDQENPLVVDDEDEFEEGETERVSIF